MSRKSPTSKAAPPRSNTGMTWASSWPVMTHCIVPPWATSITWVSLSVVLTFVMVCCTLIFMLAQRPPDNGCTHHAVPLQRGGSDLGRTPIAQHQLPLVLPGRKRRCLVVGQRSHHQPGRPGDHNVGGCTR